MISPSARTQKKNPLIDHVQKCFLELGEGFALVGRKVRLPIDGKNYYIDLLFYHIRLRCFYVVALRNTKFKPEYIDKLNLYLSSVDNQWRLSEENPAIGLLLCKTKDNFTAQYTLSDTTESKKIIEKLPTAEKIEFELEKPSIEIIETQSLIANIKQ